MTKVYGPFAMPTSDRPLPCLVDSSAAVALVHEDHEWHQVTFDALADRELGLAGHAAFETFSVLTRLPSPGRLTPRAAHQVLETNFPHTRFLSAECATRLLADLAPHGIAGGSVYDALVGAAAVEHGMTLVSRDRRAMEVYGQLAVDVEMIG